MIAIRSPSASASSMEWVVSSIILPFFFLLIICHVNRIEYGSIPLVGSSRIITCFTWVIIIVGVIVRIRGYSQKLFEPCCFQLVQCPEITSSSCLQKEPLHEYWFCLPNQPNERWLHKRLQSAIRRLRCSKNVALHYKPYAIRAPCDDM